MILSGHEILHRLGRDIQIKPFETSRLNPNSYNLTLHDELMVYEDSYGAFAIAISGGDASRLLGAGPGDEVRIGRAYD